MLDDIRDHEIDKRVASVDEDGFKVDEASNDEMFVVGVYRVISFWD